MLELNNGRYEIQGVALEDIASEYDAPVYVYDADKIESQYKRLTNAFSGVNIKVKYAAKALTNISILKLINSFGAGLDLVSINEVKLGLSVGVKPEDIFFTSNGVAFEEIQEAVKLGVSINIDNLHFLEEIGKTYGNTLPICIRINPHIVAGGNAKIQTGHVGSKFGISIFQEDNILEIIEKYNINVRGLHIHTGSDVLSSEVFLQGAEIVFGIARKFSNLEFLDFGSGFKVAYKEGDITTNVERVGEKMSAAFKAFCKEYGKELEIWFEPGKFLVSESGYFLVKTNVVKPTPACTFVGVGSGQNHLIRPMMYGAHHDVFNVSNPTGEEHVYNVVGYICETDTFATDCRMNEVRVNDLLAIKNAGAYCFSMSSNYNSRVRPAEVLVYKGKAHLIRQRESFEDLTRHQIEIDL